MNRNKLIIYFYVDYILEPSYLITHIKSARYLTLLYKWFENLLRVQRHEYKNKLLTHREFHSNRQFFISFILVKIIKH